ncbi:cyclic nucleotide-gated cation channel alpha-4 isoform X2 [Takifugu flavidus]|uniref:cyclic nucleotide-gated cation channel alpha-4 isoform X2 n=1 Tax=Takifugu flavidus TaxID=433684 RepID=UPI0025443106|nr:cyclic nucleotide-gated cation channel alpha-4 isoform X2 [Takifugu flavidus]
MDNTSDTRPTRNRWQRLLKGRQKQKVDVIENVAKYDKNAINMLDIIWKEWLVDPAEQFYYVWLQVMILPIVYNSVIIILRTCFTTIALSYLPVWLTLDYLSDLMYIVDMIITVHTGYLDQGILVKDLTQLKQRYLHSKAFLRDLASLIPTDLLYFVFGIQTPLVRINRLLRMPRLNEALDRMETRTSYPNTFRISKLMIYIFVLIHWNACLYFALSSYIGFGSDRWVYPNITNPEFASLRRQYIYCFWFSAQIFTTVGDTPLPKREDEYLFMIADLLIAVLVFASIVGNVGNVITSLRDRDNVFFPNHELVKAYLSSHQISKELRHRIDNWYQHLHINKKIIRENEILQELPLHLRTEIAVSVHLSTLSKVTIFHNCDRSLLEELVLKLTPQVFSPGEYVCKKGDVGHEMYIIKEGKLAVVADDGVTEFAVLSDGNFFGEISIINIKAKRHLEEKGRQILTKMGMLEENGDGGEGEAATVETKIKKLESSLESLHTKLARLMAELESSNAKMQVRVELLEWEVAALHTDLSKEEEDARGVQGRGEGVGGEVQLEREEAEGEEEWEASDLKMKRQRQGEDVFNEGDGQSTTSTKEDVRKIEVDNCCGSKDPEFHEQNQDVRKIVREDGNDRLGKGDGAEMEPAEMSSGESEEKECELKTQKSEEKTN